MNNGYLGNVEPNIQELASVAKDVIATSRTWEDGATVPKFGILSLHAQNVEMQIYALPTMQATYPHTFVDGSSRIYISNPLMAQIRADKSAGMDGVLTLIMLQQMRLLMNHCSRITHLQDGRAIPEEVAQIAGETSAYCKLRMGFPELRWAQVVSEEIAARTLTAEGCDYFGRIAEERIAEHILRACAAIRNKGQADIHETVVLHMALRSLGMQPASCKHNACRDPSFIVKAVAAHERSALSDAAQPEPTLAHQPLDTGLLDNQRRL